MVEFDFNSLRSDLIDYYGTAVVSASFMAIDDLAKVEKASNEQLLIIAQSCGFNLSKYIIEENCYIKKRH